MNIDFDRFFRLRRDLMKAIDQALGESGGYCKPYEGEFDLTLTFPNFFEDDKLVVKPKFCVIELRCYLIGPGRHHSWSGKTFDEALDEAEQDIRRWIKEDADE